MIRLQQSFELNEFITLLTPIDPNSVKNLEDLYAKMHAIKQSPLFNQALKNISEIVFQRIFRQFGNPGLNSVREVCSNAIDAHHRNQCKQLPIQIVIKDNKITVQDFGDGVNVVTYFVIGRSSNPQAIFNLQKGLPQVTGRFGQGGLSPFFFVAYPLLKCPLVVPFFSIEGSKVELSILYYIEGVPNKVIFTGSQEGPIIEKVLLQNKAETTRKISILTQRQESPLSIKILEDKKVVTVTLAPCQPRHGTRYKITSPLIAIMGQKIEQYLKKQYQFVPEPPILLNGEKINRFDSYKALSFPSGILYYRLQKDKNLKPLLGIYEDGKLIQEYPMEGHALPDHIAISFYQLPLTQERATVPFQDKNVYLKVMELLTAIQEADLPLEEKALLFNGLYPILESQRCHLVDFVDAYLDSLEEVILYPDLLGIKDQFPGIFVHPEYLCSSNLPILYMRSVETIYLLEESMYALGKHLDKKILMLGKDCVDFTEPGLNYFNLLLVQEWASNKLDSAFQLDTEWLKSNYLSTSLNYTQAMVSKSNAEAYQNIENGEAVLNSKQIIEYFQERIKTTAHKENAGLFELWLNTIKDKLILEHRTLYFKKAVYFCDKALECSLIKADQKFNESLQLLLFNRIFSLPALAYALQFIKEHEANGEDLYARSFISAKYAIEILQSSDPLEYCKLEYIYNRLMRLLKTYQITSPEDVKSFISCVVNESQDTLDTLETLLQKILHVELRKMILPKEKHALNDLTYLLTLPLKELYDLLYHLRAIPPHSIYKDDYIFLTKFLLNLRCENRAKLFIIESYFRIRDLLVNFIKQTKLVNLNAFQEMFFEEVQANLKLEDASAFLNEVTTTANHLNSYEAHLLQYMVKNPSQFIEGPNGVMNTIPNFNDEPLKGFPTRADSIAYVTRFLVLTNGEDDGGKMEEVIDHCERCGYIQDRVRPILFAALLSNDAQFLSRNYVFPKQLPGKDPILLHDDPDVAGWVGGVELAKIRIESAKKYNSSPHFWMLEKKKNSFEHGATEIRVDAHLDAEGNLYIVWSDDGLGMGDEEIKALKTPGFSTKRKGEEDPNQGLGFFSVFKNFSEVLVSTSSNEDIKREVLFANTANGIMLQNSTSEGLFKKGSTFIMKIDQPKNPMMTLLKIKGLFVSRFQFVTEGKIYFGSKLVNHKQINASIVEQNEEYFYQGKSKGILTVKVNNSNSGIFRKETKIDNLDEKYTSLINRELHSRMTDDNVCIATFLPTVEEVINRSQTMEEKELLPIIQRNVCFASLKYFTSKWLLGHHLDLLSKDVWNDFRTLRNVTMNKTGDFHGPIKQKMIEQMQAFFKPILDKVQFEGTLGLEELTNRILRKDRALFFEKDMEEIKKISQDLRLTLSLLMSFPLKEQGGSLLQVRSVISKSLQEIQFIDEKGAYNLALIHSKDIKDLQGMLTECMSNVQKVVKANVYNQILRKFMDEILGKVEGIKEQQRIATTLVDEKVFPPSLTESLSYFLKQTAKEFLNIEVDLEFYMLAEGVRAKTFRGSNKILINRLACVEFTELCDKYVSNGFSLKGLEEEWAKVAKRWLTTLVHELVHIHENSDCISSHDKLFKEHMAEFMHKLLLKPGQRNVINVLEEALLLLSKMKL